MGMKGVSNTFNWTFSWFAIFSMCELPHLWATKMMLKINSFVRLLFICLLTIDSSPWGHRNVFWFYHRAREYRRPNLAVVTGIVFNRAWLGVPTALYNGIDITDGSWISLSMGDEFWVKCLVHSQPTFLKLILKLNDMVTVLSISKPDNFQLHNYLKLSSIKISSRPYSLADTVYCSYTIYPDTVVSCDPTLEDNLLWDG